MDGQTVPLDALSQSIQPFAAPKPGHRGAAMARRCLGRWVLVGVLVAFCQVGSVRAEVRTYAIDANASSLQVLVDRAGVLSLLAHDHVFVAAGFAGRVTLDTADLSRSALQLTVPVASLQIDPAGARQALGLAGKLNDSDRAEIRQHMMAANQLDLARYPRVTATLASISGTPPDLVLGLHVRIKATDKVLRVPVHLQLAGDELLATGEATLVQSDFGIEPYSTLLGAIAVKDRVRVRFHIVARAEAG